MGWPEDAINYAMFFAGLKILQTMNLCFAGSFPVLLRFGIPPAKIGPFIGMTGACLNFGAAMGDITGFFIGLANLYKYQVPAGCSIISTVGLFVVQCILTFICLRCSGYDGVRKYFYWLCLSALIYQGDALLCTATWGIQSAWFFFALELTNVLIPIIHAFASWYAKYKTITGLDLLTLKLKWQLYSMVFLTGVCVVLWCVCVSSCWSVTNNTQNGGLNDSEDITGAPKKQIAPFGDSNVTVAWEKSAPAGAPPGGWRHCQKIAIVISPFFMGLIGMGSIFWLFPVVFPFMVCHYSHFEFTQKLNLALGALATLIVWFIAELNAGTFYGANNFKWKVLQFHDWSGVSKGDGTSGNTDPFTGGKYWNCTWFILLPVIFLTWMFFKCLHYPRCFVSRSVLYSKWAVLWGCTFFFISQLFKAFGLNGVFHNAILTAKISPLGNISFMLSMIHLTASLFTNQAYSDGYSSFKCAVESGCSWPTQGVGGLRSFWWWHRYGVRNGTKRFFGLRRIDIVAVMS